MKHPLLQFRRMLKSSVNSVVRNPWFAIASTTVMTLALLTVSVFFMMTLMVNKAADVAKEKVGVATINIKDWVSEKEILELKNKVHEIPGVTAISFISKAEALERFKQQHKDDPLLLEAVAEENPLFNSLEVRVSDPENFTKVKELLENRTLKSYVQDFSFDGDRQATITRIGSVSNFIKRLGFVLTSIFVVVAAVIIFNTIRLGIFSRKNEIEIMYLNGATKSFIRSPFLIEGAMYGLLAILITFLVFGTVFHSTSVTLTRYFGELGDVRNYLRSNIALFGSILLAIGVGLGLFSSWLAVNKHLEVK